MSERMQVHIEDVAVIQKAKEIMKERFHEIEAIGKVGQRNLITYLIEKEYKELQEVSSSL